MGNRRREVLEMMDEANRANRVADKRARNVTERKGGLVRKKIKAADLVVGDVVWHQGMGPYKVLALSDYEDYNSPQVVSPWGTHNHGVRPDDEVELDNGAVRKALKAARFATLVDERDRAQKGLQDALATVRTLQAAFEDAANEINTLRAQMGSGEPIRLLKSQLKTAQSQLRAMTYERDQLGESLERTRDEYHALSVAARKQGQELEQVKADRDAAVEKATREKAGHDEVMAKWKACYSKWEYECAAKIEAQRALARVERELAAMTERAENAEAAYGEACDDPGALPSEPTPGPQAEAVMRLVRLVSKERARQKQMHPHRYAGKQTRAGNHLILSEEVGEVAAEVQRGDKPALEAELTQVATVALGWLAGEMGLDW